jgi:hypothetical protein
LDCDEWAAVGAGVGAVEAGVSAFDAGVGAFLTGVAAVVDERGTVTVVDRIGAVAGDGLTEVGGMEVDGGVMAATGDGVDDRADAGVDDVVPAATGAGVGAVAGEWEAIFIRHRAMRTAPASHHLQRGKIFRSFPSSPIIFFHISPGTSEG